MYVGYKTEQTLIKILLQITGYTSTRLTILYKVIIHNSCHSYIFAITTTRNICNTGNLNKTYIKMYADEIIGSGITMVIKHEIRLLIRLYSTYSITNAGLLYLHLKWSIKSYYTVFGQCLLQVSKTILSIQLGKSMWIFCHLGVGYRVLHWISCTTNEDQTLRTHMALGNGKMWNVKNLRPVFCGMVMWNRVSIRVSLWLGFGLVLGIG